MGLVRTVREIAGNPDRARGWKIFDLTLVVGAWLGVVVTWVLGWGHGGFSEWTVYRRLALLFAVSVSATSWYRFPRERRRHRKFLRDDSTVPRV